MRARRHSQNRVFSGRYFSPGDQRRRQASSLIRLPAYPFTKGGFVPGAFSPKLPASAACTKPSVTLLSSSQRRRILRASSGVMVLSPAAWAMVDAAGNSQIGVWPVFIGATRFALLVAGRPLFSKTAFVDLIRTLVRRLAASAAEAGQSIVVIQKRRK